MCVCVCVCVCVAKPVAVELRCHATALIFLDIKYTLYPFFCNTYNIQDLILVVLKVHIINMYYYANMPMQYTAIFHGCENGNFQVTKCNIFLIFVPTIYVLEQK